MRVYLPAQIVSNKRKHMEVNQSPPLFPNLNQNNFDNGFEYETAVEIFLENRKLELALMPAKDIFAYQTEINVNMRKKIILCQQCAKE